MAMANTMRSHLLRWDVVRDENVSSDMMAILENSANDLLGWVKAMRERQGDNDDVIESIYRPISENNVAWEAISAAMDEVLDKKDFSLRRAASTVSPR